MEGNMKVQIPTLSQASTSDTRFTGSNYSKNTMKIPQRLQKYSVYKGRTEKTEMAVTLKQMSSSLSLSNLGNEQEIRIGTLPANKQMTRGNTSEKEKVDLLKMNLMTGMKKSISNTVSMFQQKVQSEKNEYKTEKIIQKSAEMEEKQKSPKKEKVSTLTKEKQKSPREERKSMVTKDKEKSPKGNRNQH